MAEHVRQVTDRHRAAELASSILPVLEVPQDRLAGDQELVHQHLPRPDREPAVLDEPTDPLLGLGPHLEIVVERRQLAVEREAVALVRLHDVQQPVDEPDELKPKALER